MQVYYKQKIKWDVHSNHELFDLIKEFQPNLKSLNNIDATILTSY